MEGEVEHRGEKGREISEVERGGKVERWKGEVESREVERGDKLARARGGKGRWSTEVEMVGAWLCW